MITGQRSLKILVAEDDELIGELLAEMLAGMGHEVCGIASSESGTVDAALQCHPDLMIVDIQLSPGSGIGAVETIMRTATIPHVLVSGNVDRALALRPKRVVLQKPYTLAMLNAAIHSASATF